MNLLKTNSFKFEVSPRCFNELFCSWRKYSEVSVDCRWWATQLGVYSKNITAAITLGSTPPLPSIRISHQMGKDLIANQEGRVDANTHSSSSLKPIITLPSAQTAQTAKVKTLATAHCEFHGPSLTLHFSWRSWPSWARLSLPVPSWVTCFLSSMISLMRLFHKEKNDIKCRGLDKSNSYALRHRVRLQVQRSLGTREGLIESILPAPLFFLSHCNDPPLKLWKRSPVQILELISKNMYGISNVFSLALSSSYTFLY